MWTARKTNQGVLDHHIKPEISQEAKMMQLRLSYIGQIIRRQDSLEKTIMLGRVEGCRKGGRPNSRRSGSLNEATWLDIQELSGAVEVKTFWRFFNS